MMINKTWLRYNAYLVDEQSAHVNDAFGHALALAVPAAAHRKDGQIIPCGRERSLSVSPVVS